MIKIFIESGVNDAKKHDKDTTNEQDLIEKVITKHFPKCQYGKDFEIIGTGGWTKLPKLTFEFESNSDFGGINLVIFDADEIRNGGGFSKRQVEISGLMPPTINYGLFLWPDNKTDGDFELLLSKIINSNHQCILDGYDFFENEIKKHDPKEEKYDLPGRKGEMYTYISLHKKSKEQTDAFKRGYWLFDNSDFWNLTSDELNPLLAFLEPHFSKWK